MTKLQKALGGESACTGASNGYFKSYEENIFGGRMRPEARAMFNRGSGSELSASGKRKAKAASVYSSSMLAYNAFHWISEKRPFHLKVGNRLVTFTHVYFEVKLRTLRSSRQPANMDVLLVSNDGSVWLMIESKFTEYLANSKFSMSDTYLKIDAYFKGQGDAWVKHIAGLKKKMRERPGYLGGVKQNLCHMIALRNLLYGDAAAIKYVNEVNGLKFTPATKVYFWNLVFDPDPKQFEKEFSRYEDYYRLWMAFTCDVLDKKVFGEVDFGFIRYSYVLREIIAADSAPKDLKHFLKKRYLQFAAGKCEGSL